MAARTRNYCFTHNNYPDTVLEDNIDCQYIVYGKEVGESGTPHLQGFIRFSCDKSLKAAIKALPGCHVEVAQTLDAAIAYCKKDGLFVERGTAPISNAAKGSKEKRRWDEIRVAAEEGRLEDIPDDIRFLNPRVIDYHRTKALRSQELSDTEDRMLWYWGESGSGKSRKAREENPDAFLKMCNKWWDGYERQDVVIIEDFDKSHSVLGHHLKIWADRYPFPAEIKGGSIKIRPRLVIVTSNYAPQDIWEDNNTLLPILRRFKTVEFKLLAKQKLTSPQGL